MTRVLAAQMSFVCASTQAVQSVQIQEAPFVRENDGHGCRTRQQDQSKKRVLCTGWGDTGESRGKHGGGSEGPREGRKAGETSQ